MGSEATRAMATGNGFLLNPTDAFTPMDFRRLAEHLPHMVWVCQPDGTLDYLNSHGLEYFGVKLRNATALFPSGAIAHPEDRAGSLAAWKRALQGRETLSVET